VNVGRHVAACAVILLMLGSAWSCTTVLGLNSAKSIASELCTCWEQMNADFRSESECQEFIVARFKGIDEAQRDAWLKRYVAECTECPSVDTCFYLPPVCSTVACKYDWECCNPHQPSGGCNAEGHCK
jgi:hypothetical protein